MAVVPVPEKWDYEADVIVVGAGTAGLPAAIVAAEAGAKVAILELMSYCASSLALINFGPAFAGTDEQKAAGIQDSPEQFYKDGVELAKGDPEFWKLFTDLHLDVYRWCKTLGMKFEAPLRGGRTHLSKGTEMLRCLERTAKEKGAEILFLHRATRLIIDPQTGRVLGLKVRVKDKEQNFKAKRAVILATGGFGQNKEMVQEYGPEYDSCHPTMPPSHLGDGLKMAMAIGAGTTNLGSAVISSFSIDAVAKGWGFPSGAIHVNVNGKRYTNEQDPKRFYGLISKDGMKQPGGAYWSVYDEKARTQPSGRTRETGKINPQQADTIEELAKKAGIDPKELKETIDKYNSDIKSAGYDTVFGRRPPEQPGATMLTIDTPPFYAIKLMPATSSFKGGLKINTDCQVINQYGEVIPNLYAAGEVTGGLWGAHGTYFGGTMVAASMTFGRIAGKNAAAEPSW